MWLKSIKENKTSYLYWGYLFIFGIIFYLMNVLTPFYIDDWHYQFKYGTTIPIQSISDILESQYKHYFQMNGRFIPHFIVQFFDGIAGKAIFNIANTFIFLVFIHLLPKVITHKSTNNILLSSIFLFIIVTFSTMFGEWYLWMSGACNYLWTATFLIIFHYMLFFCQIKYKLLYPLLFIWGVICGWTNESIVIGAGVGYFLYFLTNYNHITTARLFLLTGFYCGIIFLIIAPSNFNRAINTGTFDSFNLMSYIWTLISLKKLSILSILFLFVLLSTYNKTILNFIKNNIFIIISLIISICFIILIKTGSSRAHFGVFFFSLILVLKFIATINNVKPLFYLSIIILLIGTFPIISTAAKNYHEYQNLISQIKKTNNGIICTNEVYVHPFIDKYIVKLYTSEYNEFYSGYMKTYYENKYIAKAFNKSQIVFIPQKFMMELQDKPETYNKFIIPSQYPFYASIIKEDTISKVTYLLNNAETKDIPFYLRPFSSKLSRYNLERLDASQYNIITINNQKILFVGKNWSIDRRLKDIIIE